MALLGGDGDDAFGGVRQQQSEGGVPSMPVTSTSLVLTLSLVAIVSSTRSPSRRVRWLS